MQSGKGDVQDAAKTGGSWAAGGRGHAPAVEDRALVLNGFLPATDGRRPEPEPEYACRPCFTAYVLTLLGIQRNKRLDTT